jgi:hypothetical protein
MDKLFCTSSYETEDAYEDDKSLNDEFSTKQGAYEAFERLKKGGRFYAVAYGYRGATGEYVTFGEWFCDSKQQT